MSDLINQEDVKLSILRGIADAHQDYLHLSGGEWLEWAPEYFITTSIARSVKRSIPLDIFLENNTREAAQDSGAHGKGRLSKLIRPEGRIDILIYGLPDSEENIYPKVVIEVKHRVYSFEKLDLIWKE
ncbi:MAG: hypothetical protein HZC51_13145 [Nitrospirae bacterium]|nr:hypothetical protein [Nitrospirota bacterium]